MQNPESRRGLQFTCGAILILLLCGLSYVYFDRLAIDYFLAADPHVVNFFRYVTELGDALYPLLAGGLLYLFCRLRQRGILSGETALILERWKQRGLFLFLAVASSGLLVDLLKVLFGRARPTKLLTENLYGFSLFEFSSKMHSFPSGHSNTAVATALVLWYLWPKSWPIGLLLAGGVALSRVVLLKHYPSDTLAGAYVAVVTTFYLYQFFCRRAPAVFNGGKNEAESA
jgi:membrane-associated phospholipid phosphatase